MAVKDESLHHATEDLILPKPRKYYRAAIQTEHWQLRSLISSPQQDIVYYPSGNEVIRLDTKKQEREVITTLSFAPKCLTASKEWLCCGGDDGKYMAVCLDESKRQAAEGNTDPDARLPIDLDPSSRTTPREASSSPFATTPRRSRGPLPSKPSKIGSDLVNCIELWTPTPSASEDAYDIPIAILANNDRSVFLIDVAESRILEHIDFPDNVNRAVMSPDGTLLVSICDDPYLYLHKRTRRIPHGNSRLPIEDGSHYRWEDCGRLGLEGQKQSDKSTMRGSFAACFSNSGKYLAVATQYGLISIFDVATLLYETADSLLKVFTTSRPGREHGAVRAMSFSPGPFDLLAWTESSGRIGVADLRNMFLSKQTIAIDSHAEGVERALVMSRPNDTVIDPRLRSFRAESPSDNSTTPDYLGLDLERRQLRHLTSQMLDRHQAPLTTEELEVLQAHRIARRQRDEANEARETSERASSSRLSLLRDITTLTNSGGSRPPERRISTSNLPAALREFVNPERSAASFRSFINERNQDRERRSQLEQEPRRLNLIQLAAAESAIERETLGPSTPRNNSDPASALERLTLTSSRQPPTGSDSPSNPWAEIDALYRARFPTDPPLDRSTRLRIEIEDEDRRDFAHRLRQPWRPSDDLNPASTEPRGGHSSLLRSMLRNGSFETMGCSWSEDGRVLYAGAEDGIHEYHVNVGSRKIFPSLVLR